MTICIFPGTFNPIHIAHLKMAQFALEHFGFEKVIFIPSHIPPHKTVDKNLAQHRYNMVKLAVSKNPRFEISDIEYKSDGKSYTLYTVQKIKDLYNIDGRVNMLIGTDAFKNVRMWYRADELIGLVHFIVFPRTGDDITMEEYKDFSYELVNAEKIDVSSTEIREKHVGRMSMEVEDYIKANELYS